MGWEWACYKCFSLKKSQITEKVCKDLKWFAWAARAGERQDRVGELQECTTLSWLLLAGFHPIPFLPSTLPDFLREHGRQENHLLLVIPDTPPQLLSPASDLSWPHRRKIQVIKQMKQGRGDIKKEGKCILLCFIIRWTSGCLQRPGA